MVIQDGGLSNGRTKSCDLGSEIAIGIGIGVATPIEWAMLSAKKPENMTMTKIWMGWKMKPMTTRRPLFVLEADF